MSASGSMAYRPLAVDEPVIAWLARDLRAACSGMTCPELAQ